jgi:hypothetical protein
MATDFRDLAAKAKADHDARVKAEQARDAEARDAYNRTSAKAVSLLEEQILPLLAQAKADLAATSVQSEIDKDFDLAGFVSKKPTISFWCKGPRRDDGYQFKDRGSRFLVGWRGHYDQGREGLGSKAIPRPNYTGSRRTRTGCPPGDRDSIVSLLRTA